MPNEDVEGMIKELEQVAQDYYRTILVLITKYGDKAHGMWFLSHYMVEEVNGTLLLVDVMTGQTMADKRMDGGT